MPWDVRAASVNLTGIATIRHFKTGSVIKLNCLDSQAQRAAAELNGVQLSLVRYQAEVN